jgi:hypothetical protein
LTDALPSLVIPYKAIPIEHFDNPETTAALATFAKDHPCTIRVDRRYRVIIVPDRLADEAKKISNGGPIECEAGKSALGCI